MTTNLGRLYKLIFKTPISDTFNKKRYVFHHLQKCGGTSLKKSLEDFYILKKDYAYKGEEPLNFDMLSSFDLLVGHFEMNETKLFERYPQVEGHNVFLFTMVREPFKLMISLYYYWKGRGWIEDISLVDFLNSKKNYLSKLMYCTEENWELMLEKYSFIGVLERYEESLGLLSLLTRRNFRKYNVENKSLKDQQLIDVENDPDFIEDFKKKNSLDYLIYNQSFLNFEKVLSQYRARQTNGQGLEIHSDNV